MSPRPPSSRIRRARLSDLPELAGMMGAFTRSEHIRWQKQRVLPAVRTLLGDRRLGCILVAEEGSGSGRALRGYAVATFGYDLEYAGPDAFLTEIYVRPQNRRTGEGRRLLRAITERMRDGGAGAIHLAVWPANRAARRLYEAAGFAPLPRLVLTKRLARRRAT